LVAIRKCPYCQTAIPAGVILAHSYDLTCAGCGKPLEISRISRNLSVLLALVSAYFAWRAGTYVAPDHGAIGWLLPVLYSILVYGIVAPIVLVFAGDLSLRTGDHVPQTHAVEPSHGAPGGGHSAAHH
jgi:hypothetical protein